jgi:hypothetical protein
MVQFEPSPSMPESWETGDLLEDALLIFAPPILLKSFCDSGIESEQREILHTLLEFEFAQKLMSGELLAVALQSRPPSDGQPIAIPQNFFKDASAQFNWEENSIDWNEQRFVQVKIIKYPLGAIKETKNKKPGPISSDSDISEAIDYIRGTNPLFDSSIQKTRISYIRQRMSQQNPGRYNESDRPSDATIRRFLKGPKFKLSKIF